MVAGGVRARLALLAAALAALRLNDVARSAALRPTSGAHASHASALARHPLPHPLPSSTWPSAATAAQSALFSSLHLGALELCTRTWIPAMVPWRATEEGLVTPQVLDWYERFARGKPGAIVVEATGIRDVPSGPLLRIGHERFVPGLRELVEVVRRASEGETRLFLQIIDFLRIRRRVSAERFLGEFLGLREEHFAALRDLGRAVDDEASARSALLALSSEELARVLSPAEHRELTHGARETVNDLHLPHVAELPRVLPTLFASAARRARDAGFDGVELHYAHAYTMASFLSRRNERNDGYGGSARARVRLPLEVLAAVRAAVGSDFAVGARILSDEIIDGGSRLEEALFYARELAAQGLDFLSLSRGGKFEDATQPKVGEAAYPYTGTSGHECMPTVHVSPGTPFGRNLAHAAAIRAHLRSTGLSTPIVAAGGIGTFDLAESALASGACDVVGMARASLADPDWSAKVRAGAGAEVRRCKYTNYCEALDQRHKQVTCQLWDRAHDAPLAPGTRVARSVDSRRRLTAPPWERTSAEADPRG
ncbi:MAG: NADH:flavin oxidoreductase [Planctomycetes bacterium]|nr:NADH:flavin oxidoreductase [Planctomycetota bacterium]